jgi:hypothetical protein
MLHKSHTIKMRSELLPGNASVCFSVSLVELNATTRLNLLLLLLLLLLCIMAAHSRSNQGALWFPTKNLKP